MEQIIYELNNKKYLLVELLTTERQNGQKAKDLGSKLVELGCIVQGIKEVKRSIWFTSYVITKILVPEDKIEEYRKI